MLAKRKPQRLSQINDLIQLKFAEIITQELELPEGVLVTVTQVKTSADLRHARIGLSIYPAESVEPIFALIRRNLRSLKFQLHQHLTLKFAPDVKVYLDRAEQQGFELEAILDKIKRHGVENS